MARRNRLLRPNIPPPPAWHAITVGTWIEVPGTSSGTLAAVAPHTNASINPNGTSNAPWTDLQSNVVSKWCGASYDYTNDVLWIPIAGGHGDYAGNESYRIDLASGSSFAWELHHEPSGSIQYSATLSSNGTNYYSDGRPRAIHTYNQICWTPSGNFMFGIQTPYSAGFPYETPLKPLLMTDSTGEWTTLTPTWPSAVTSPGGICYDATRNAVWALYPDSTPMARYNFSGNTITSHGTGQDWANYNSITHNASEDIIIVTCGGAPTFRVFDCATNAWTAPSLTGSPPSGFAISGYEQAHWVPDLGCLCMWNNSSNTTKIATLTPSGNPRSASWAWGELAVDGGSAVTPSAKTTNGTFGRFQYAPNLGGFLLFNSTTDPVYFFKAH